jgi:hypothetical protein
MTPRPVIIKVEIYSNHFAEKYEEISSTADVEYPPITNYWTVP